MNHRTITADPQGPSVEAYLLGPIDYDICLALQQRLVYEISGRRDGQIALLLCEHPLSITVGRRGSWSHIHFDEAELARRSLQVKFVNRGDGVMLHAPGQLAVYPIVPLEWHGFTVGEYLDRLQSGLAAALAEQHPSLVTRPGQHGIWGRTGQIASMGVAVRSWTTYHGAFVNVAPPLHWFPRIDTDPTGGTHMSSLLAERHSAVKMTRVRSDLINAMTAALGCDRHHVYTGHPLLADVSKAARVNRQVS